MFLDDILLKNNFIIKEDNETDIDILQNKEEIITAFGYSLLEPISNVFPKSDLIPCGFRLQ